MNAILALALTTVILTGGIDISVGSTLAFSGAAAAWLLRAGHSTILAVFVALVIGLAIGTLNGIFISRWNLQPMIVTLATMSIFRGTTYLLTTGSPISVSNPAFKMIGGGKLFGTIQVPIIILLVLAVIMHYILNNTPFGRHIYSIGGNEEAAYLSGVNTKNVKAAAYAISGLLASVVGIIMTSRLSSAQPLAGQSYEMDAIAAAVIGGTSLRGGQGKVVFSIVGALIIGMLNNILTLLDVSTYYQTVIKGIVILIAVMIDAKSN
jgi:ribose transport system permease protein